MPTINPGLVKAVNPGFADKIENGLRYQESLQLEKDKINQQQTQFKMKLEADKLTKKLNLMQEYTKFQSPEEAAKTFNSMFDMTGLEGEIGPNEAEPFRKDLEKFQKEAKAKNMPADQQTDIMQVIIDKYSSVDKLSSQVKDLEDKKIALEKQSQIISQAEQMANSLPDSYLQGRSPAVMVEPLSAMIAQGLKPDQIWSALGLEKPGVAAGRAATLAGKQRITQTAEEIALELYNKPFTSLTPEERADVLQTKQDRAVEVSTGKVKGRIEAGLDAPLSSTDLTKFVNPDTLAKFTAGTTMRDVKSAGGFAATPTQLQKIADLDNAGFIVTQLDELSKQIITAPDAISALAQGATLKAGAFAKTNTAAASYEDQLAQFTGVISRALGGERGVLTDTDIRRVVNGMPKFRDTKAIRDFKMGVIQLLFETATDAQKRAITGRPKDPKIKKELNVLLDAIGLAGKRIDLGKRKEIPAQRDTSALDINEMTAEEAKLEEQRLLDKQGQ